MKKVISMLMCLLMMLTVTMDVCNAATRVVNAVSGTDFKNCTKISKGTTKVKLKGKDTLKRKNVIFTAPTDGTYKFKLSGMKVSDVEVGGCQLIVLKGSKNVSDEDYVSYNLGYDDEYPGQVFLIGSGYKKGVWSKDDEDFAKKVKDSATFKVFLVKGETIVFSASVICSVDGGNISKRAPVQKNASYKVKISKVK